MKPNLTIVSDEPIDIGQLIRADILKRDWGAMWIASEKNKAVELGDRTGRWAMPVSPARALVNRAEFHRRGLSASVAIARGK
jgi:hypothetical protein